MPEAYFPLAPDPWHLSQLSRLGCPGAPLATQWGACRQRAVGSLVGGGHGGGSPSYQFPNDLMLLLLS